MSSPSSVQPCPEPTAYSIDSYSAAEVEATSAPSSVIDNKGLSSRFAEVDSVLSGQVGPITNPVTESQPAAPVSFPVLPVVNENNATPVLSSNLGSDINNSYTLLQNTSSLPTSVLGSDISPVVSSPVTASTALPNLVSFTPTNTITGPVSSVPTAPVESIQTNSLTPSESFDNINKNQNLAKFIQKNQPNTNEHFNGVKTKEHFSLSTGSSTVDTLILCVIIGVVVYFIISPSNSGNANNVVNDIENTVSKIPVLSQLVDPAVSDSNKLLIVAAIVLAFIFISNMLN